MSRPGKIVWLTGQPCSGKTTIVKKLAKVLHCLYVDGDILRKSRKEKSGFDDMSRFENVIDAMNIANYIANLGFPYCFVSLISPFRNHRKYVREMSTASKFYEIYIKCKKSIREERDVKGMYRAAQQGRIENFTGVSGKYEKPKNPDLIVNTGIETIDESVQKILDLISVP